MDYQSIFKRYEKKYLMSQSQYNALMNLIAPRLERDIFYDSNICSIYYDTPDYRLIRASIEKPVFKEKLRLRTYGVPGSGDHMAFVELKKKIDRVVYKRRYGAKLDQAAAWLAGAEAPPVSTQITREIDWFRQYYGGLQPSIMVSYRRLAYRGIEDPMLRVTFDSDVTWRDYDLDLKRGIYGETLLGPGQVLMEVKFSQALPLWLARALDSLGIRSAGFSKCGRAYRAMCASGRTECLFMPDAVTA